MIATSTSQGRDYHSLYTQFKGEPAKASALCRVN
jgi:hypothetical protein